MTPARLVRPKVGLIPTTELALEGHRIDPSVSVPSDTVTMFVATDIADPVLEPHGSAVATYGFYTNSRNLSIQCIHTNEFGTSSKHKHNRILGAYNSLFSSSIPTIRC